MHYLWATITGMVKSASTSSQRPAPVNLGGCLWQTQELLLSVALLIKKRLPAILFLQTRSPSLEEDGTPSWFHDLGSNLIYSSRLCCDILFLFFLCIQSDTYTTCIYPTIHYHTPFNISNLIPNYDARQQWLCDNVWLSWASQTPNELSTEHWLGGAIEGRNVATHHPR